MADNKLPNAIHFDLNSFYYDEELSLSGNVNLSNSFVNYSDRFQTIGVYDFLSLSQQKYFVGDPCGEGTLGAINNNLLKLFEILKTVQKFNDVYVQGTVNKIQALEGKIKSIISAIAGVLKTLVQRLRNWLLNKVKALIENALESILPPLLKTIKEALGEAIFDQLFCKLEEIIEGLVDLVGDFIYSLIGQIINAPLCAVEQWTNALINNLVNQIDAALEPIFDQINDILSGVAQISGSVSSAISYILGFQGFLCGQPECPELKEFINDLNGSVSPTAVDNFNNFDFGISDSFAGEITQTANEWLDDFFGPDSNTSQSPGDCYTGIFECGIPQIVLFGGGGSGAAAQAVVNTIGQVVGANLLSGGSGYTSPPFVSIVDPAGCMVNASAYSEIGPDGDVTDVVIDTPGYGSSDTYNGGGPVITTFTGSPNPIVVGNTVTLEWNVSNADNVSLQDYSSYNNLPLVGSVNIPITTEMVSFSPGSTESTITFTLNASKSNTDSSSQPKSRTFILTVNSEGSSQTTSVNTSTPEIASFSVSPTSVGPGDIATLSWQSSNTTSVGISQGSTSVGSNLPANGSISIVVPLDYTFPTGGGNGTDTYTLTATNSNAPSGSQTDTETVSLTIVKPLNVDGISVGVGTTSVGIGTTAGIDTVNVNVPIIAGTGIGTTTGIDTGDVNSSGTGNNNAVSIISQIDVISTGIGYTSGDTITLTGTDVNNNGAQLQIQTNQIGQITNVNVISSGYGFVTIPRIVIDSETGLGAEFRVRLKFIPLGKFLQDTQLQTIDPNKLVQVVDCVGTTRATINISS